MQLFFRVFLIGMVLLCSCNSDLFVQPKSKPYYFSYKKNNPPQKPTSRVTQADSVNPIQSKFGHSQVPESTDFKTSQNRAFLPIAAEGKLNNRKPETPFSGQFTAVKTEKQNTDSITENKAPNPAKTNADSGLLIGACVLAALTAGLLALFQPKARNIAGWAKANKKKSWLLIGLGHLVLGFGGSFAGRVLHELGYLTSEKSMYVLLGVALLSAFLYPKKQENNSNYFVKSRLSLLALLVSGVLLLLNISNRNSADKSFSPLSSRIGQATTVDDDLVTSSAEWITAFPETMASPQSVDALAVFLILIAVAAYVVLMLAVLFLSCMIACGGQGVLSALVLVGGSVLFTSLLVLVIVKIIEGAKRRAEKLAPKSRQASDQPNSGNGTQPAPPPPKTKPEKYKYQWF